MKWIFGGIFVIGYYFGNISGVSISKDIKSLDEKTLDCDLICRTKENGEFVTDTKRSVCRCPTVLDIHDSQLQFTPDKEDQDKKVKLMKRDTLKDMMKKRNKNKTFSKSSILLTTEKPKKNFFQNQKKVPKNLFSRTPVQTNKQPAKYKELLEDRFRELKSRMSGKPQFRSRGNFKKDEKPNLIEQIKSKQAEMKKKIKEANSQPKAKFNILKENIESPNRLQNRFDIGASKLGSIHKKSKNEKSEKDSNGNNIESTTVASKTSNLPLVVMLPSTTASPQSAPVVKSINTEDNNETNSKKTEPVSSAIERIKEKQKEAVSKIKDKISMGKTKLKDKVETVEKETLP